MMRSDRRGLTLLELSVALVLIGLMSLIGFSAFSSVIDHRRTVIDATVETERASALRNMLHGWLLPATVSVQVGGNPRGARTGNTRMTAITASSTPSVTPAAIVGDELNFVTTAENPSGAPQATIRLYVDEDESTPEVGLAIEYRTSAQAPLLRRQLDADIGGMVVEFLDTRTNRWYPAVEASTITPRAVRLTLEGAEGVVLSPILGLPMVFPTTPQGQNPAAAGGVRGGGTTGGGRGGQAGGGVGRGGQGGGGGGAGGRGGQAGGGGGPGGGRQGGGG